MLSSFVKIRFYVAKIKLRRYQIADVVARVTLELVGRQRIDSLFQNRVLNFFPPLKTIVGLLILRSRTIQNESPRNLYEYFKGSQVPYIQYALGDWLFRHRNYSQETEDILRVVVQGNAEIVFCFRYIDFICQKYGFRSSKLELVLSRLLDRSIYVNLTRVQKARLATILFCQNRSLLAVGILDDLGEDYLANTPVNAYLLHKACENGFCRNPFIVRGGEIYKEMIAHRVTFEEMLRVNKESFCVVGNGPSELGRGAGKEIDANNLVIRINDYHVDHPEDYGAKQGVWVRVANKEITQDHLHSNEIVIFAANNFLMKRRDFFTYAARSHHLGKAFTVVPSEIYQELIDVLEGLPSTGLAIIYWIYKVLGPIPRESLYGFSHLKEIADFKAHYYPDKCEIGVHIHEWDKEVQLLAQIIR